VADDVDDAEHFLTALDELLKNDNDAGEKGERERKASFLAVFSSLVCSPSRRLLRMDTSDSRWLKVEHQDEKRMRNGDRMAERLAFWACLILVCGRDGLVLWVYHLNVVDGESVMIVRHVYYIARFPNGQWT